MRCLCYYDVEILALALHCIITIIFLSQTMFSNMAMALYMPTQNLTMHPRVGRRQHNHFQNSRCLAVPSRTAVYLPRTRCIQSLRSATRGRYATSSTLPMTRRLASCMQKYAHLPSALLLKTKETIRNKNKGRKKQNNE